jgi:hypothetical protein
MTSTATFCIFIEENPKQLDQDETSEILDQSKTIHPELHEAMINTIIGIFGLPYEKSFFCLNCLENLEKIRHTNDPSPASLTVDIQKSVSVTSSVGNSLLKTASH